MLIYLSGPHGAGKTTLVQQLLHSNPKDLAVYPEDGFTFPKVEQPYYERLKAKLLRYYFESLDQGKQDQAGKVLLCNRCVYDSDAYINAYYSLGWINKKEKDDLQAIEELVFPSKPEAAIILNPSLGTLKKQLHHRWNQGTIKWNEENSDYLQAAHDAFQQLCQETIVSASLLYLTDETLEEKVNLIWDWLSSVRKVEKKESQCQR
ncbi:TPA: deoxynucleoside kinase [Candidatus Woesearchaeota archaeon]|nr:deoxynucleoside kinase [Candidatus Woesearchaeota archaeon]HIH12763.1 deoxynucleoside kinase [Candidatus Woesearchaeota archaeon]